MANSEHFASWNLSLLKHCFATSNLADTFKTGQHDKALSLFNHSQLLTANYVLFK